MKPQMHRNIPHFHPHWLIRAAVWLIAMATETTQSHPRSSLSQGDNPEDEDAYLAEKKGKKKALTYIQILLRVALTTRVWESGKIRTINSWERRKNIKIIKPFTITGNLCSACNVAYRPRTGHTSILTSLWHQSGSGPWEPDEVQRGR